MVAGKHLKNQQVVRGTYSNAFAPESEERSCRWGRHRTNTEPLLMYDIDHLDCVDIEPTLFDFIRGHFDSEWMNDKRVRLISEDGLNYLNHSDTMYDVIAIEVGQIFRPGIAFFYTADFYHRSRQRLQPGGLLTQLVSIPSLTTDQFRE